MVREIKFVEEELVISFIGTLVLVLGIIILNLSLIEPNWLFLLLSSLIIWLGLIVFIYPIVKKLR